MKTFFYFLLITLAGCGGSVAGPEGPEGTQGPQGIPGPAGANGSNGINGTNGTNGVNGEAGVMGSQGATGPQGLQGEAGAMGATGAQGLQGIPGEAGTTGAIGPQGEAGATGPIGPQGPVGEAGVTGATGPQGPAGEAGASCIVGELITFECADGSKMSQVCGTSGATYGSCACEMEVGATSLNESVCEVGCNINTECSDEGACFVCTATQCYTCDTASCYTCNGGGLCPAVQFTCSLSAQQYNGNTYSVDCSEATISDSVGTCICSTNGVQTDSFSFVLEEPTVGPAGPTVWAGCNYPGVFSPALLGALGS